MLPIILTFVAVSVWRLMVREVARARRWSWSRHRLVYWIGIAALVALLIAIRPM